MKKYCTTLLVLLLAISLQAQTADYLPTKQNLEARNWFSNNKYGLFIHWGPFSIPGSGEWVMNERNITVKNYTRLEHFFNPIDFNAAQWVSMAKNGGMKYITLITRHHDGFSMFDTKYSDFSIMQTPYKKDIVRQMADECHKQGVKLFLYYSLLDWRRDDYQYWTGRTGKGTGRSKHGDWNDYIQFMKNQLTELLTNYGEIGGIWFDGYWDQMDKENKSRTSETRADWHTRELYDLIHKLQPQCLVGNNHHMTPLPGEDFQMFEQDLPGENTNGLSFQKISNLPLETCATMNNSWGFNLTDTTYKTPAQIVNLLVRSAGNGGNLLLNIGPMPNGEIQPEFKERIAWMGNWLKTYGESIYNTKASYIRPQKWGCLTQAANKIYVHPLNPTGDKIILESVNFKQVKKAYLLKTKRLLKVILRDKTLQVPVLQPTVEDPDPVVVLEVKGI